MAHTYEVGTRAWQPDTSEGWVASEVESKTVNGDAVKLVFKLENGEVRGSCMWSQMAGAARSRPRQRRLLQQGSELVGRGSSDT